MLLSLSAFGHGDKYAALFHFSTMRQFFWQDDMIGFAKFISESLDGHVIAGQHGR